MVRRPESQKLELAQNELRMNSIKAWHCSPGVGTKHASPWQFMRHAFSSAATGAGRLCKPAATSPHTNHEGETPRVSQDGSQHSCLARSLFCLLIFCLGGHGGRWPGLGFHLSVEAKKEDGEKLEGKKKKSKVSRFCGVTSRTTQRGGNMQLHRVTATARQLVAPEAAFAFQDSVGRNSAGRCPRREKNGHQGKSVPSADGVRE